jgi:hypothetical protein
VQERHAAARAASGATDQNALTVADAPRAASEPQDTAHAAATPRHPPPVRTRRRL